MKKTEEKKNLYTNNVTKHDREEEEKKQTKTINTFIHYRQQKALCSVNKHRRKVNQNRYRRAICPIEEFE